MALVTNLTFESGYIIVHRDSGQPTKYPIADVLRAADIPALTHEQIRSLTALANINAVLIRTLIDRQVLDESFLEDGDYNLDDIIESLEGMGGDFGEPDITVD